MKFPDQVNGFPVSTYSIGLPSGTLVILGPADPDAILDDPRTEQRFYAEDEHMPYWARPWAASRMLAEFIQHRPRGDGRHAVEIGCGLGLAGLAAAAWGWRVTLTDYDADALAFARASADLNGLTNVEFQRLDWRVCGFPGDVALLLAADVLFEQRWVDPVARFIAEHGGRGLALVSDPDRGTAAGFAAALAARGMSVQRYSRTAMDTDGQRAEGTIYEIAAAKR